MIDKLQAEKQRLEKLSLYAENDIHNAPDGGLRVTHSEGKARFRHRKSKADRNGAYIPRDQLSIAQALAQKTYAEKFIKTINPKLDLIDAILQEYEANPLENAYTSQTEIRQQLTRPYFLTDEEFAEKWLAIPYEPDPNYPEAKTQETANGEMVRSKSEVIIADNLKRLGIPYKYEAPVKPITERSPSARQPYMVSDVIYPDFTCLNVKRRKIVYIEHFGIMDSQEYRDKKFFWKIRNFENYGLIQGKNLIMTFEDDANTFNFANYRKTIEEMLLK